MADAYTVTSSARCGGAGTLRRAIDLPALFGSRGTGRTRVTVRASCLPPSATRAAAPQGKPGPIEAEADGTITGVEVEDLNADGDPEIYVYVTSAGSGSYGSLIAYGSNRNRSLSEIHLPPLEDDAGASQGYMGHDTFAVGEGTLVRRFPVYREGDTNAKPTGGTRQIQYKLVAGEAGWLLRKDRIIRF